MDQNNPIGTITTRQCPACGHHEVGYTTHDGTFHALSPGDRILILHHGHPVPSNIHSILEEPSSIHAVPEEQVQPSKMDQPIAFDVWLPPPVRCDRSLCMKYGVLIPSGSLNGEMTGDLYEQAYKEKLVMLLELDSFTPLPVILDRFFSAPNLAAGSPKQIAQALLQDISEVEEPVTRVKEWLEKKDENSLGKLIHPGSIQSLNDQPISDEALKQGLHDLTLEAFFELL
ncbi:MAG: hypothetical protein JW932_01135 [Deltaproteobacteria bacterium]|nr:hypothetical protein [Deltaproteobacteria bacterium]